MIRRVAIAIVGLLMFLAIRPAWADARAASPDPAPQQVQRLIEQLGDKDYFVRQRAEVMLGRIGFPAFDALTDATTNPDLEIASRARRLVQLMKVEWADKSDPAEVKRILKDYGLQTPEQRAAKIEALGTLLDDLGSPALCRLIRYEKTPLLSKHAAIRLLGLFRNSRVPNEEVARQIRQSLSSSRRPGAVWAVLALRYDEDPAGTNAEWTRHVEAEEATLKTTPRQTNAEIIEALLRFQVMRMTKLGRLGDVAEPVAHLVRLQKDDPESLQRFLEWLIDQKQWKAIDTLAEKFAKTIDGHAALIYFMAEALAGQGQVERAQEMADRAFKLNSGKDPKPLIQHYLVAANLQLRGRFDWAKREYRHLLDNAPATGDVALSTRRRFAEMLHDQGEEKEAAEVLDGMDKALGVNRPPEAQIGGVTLGEMRARRDYFFACHWALQGDPARHREYLDKALADDSSDIDVLIGCYRLPNTAAEFRQKILKLIDHAASDLRERISDEPDTAANYNQFAWLIGNTEGNLDEALQYSRKSLELSPETGGYYDTLGRVCFARSDYENAVKYQSRALEFEPHSGQMKKQLALFKKKLEAKAGQPEGTTGK